jgi:hypothetical protein
MRVSVKRKRAKRAKIRKTEDLEKILLNFLTTNKDEKYCINDLSFKMNIDKRRIAVIANKMAKKGSITRIELETPVEIARYKNPIKVFFSVKKLPKTTGSHFFIIYCIDTRIFSLIQRILLFQ